MHMMWHIMLAHDEVALSKTTTCLLLANGQPRHKNLPQYESKRKDAQLMARVRKLESTMLPVRTRLCCKPPLPTTSTKEVQWFLATKRNHDQAIKLKHHNSVHCVL
eukprot:771295-Amphidinium_carterae.2